MSGKAWERLQEMEISLRQAKSSKLELAKVRH